MERMKPRIAIIGGTGIGHRLADLGGSAVVVPTPDGAFRAQVLDRGSHELVLIQRHGPGHKSPPHRVNYRALARGAKAFGVSCVMATAAVGCLRAEWPVGSFVLCSDFLDFTYRRITMWDREVRHVDFTQPFSPRVRQSLLDVAQTMGLPIEPEAVYGCGDGPRYETPHEIVTYRQLGVDLVGMTAVSEAIAFRELGLDYACLSIVTNHAAGMGAAELTHEEVVEVMEEAGEKAVQLMLEAAGRLGTG